MADLTIAERLQPSLLDRLTDDQPKSKDESRRERVIDIKRLRDIIQRDLSWLLNTTNLESEIDLEPYPQIQSATINFGVIDVAGKRGGVNRAIEIRQAIRTSIENFEPRILPGSLEVELYQEMIEGGGAIVSFDIRGELWAQPVPLELYMRTALDITTGEVSLDRQF
ncbi:MAG: type VI secretion system baseplate subunit TssE [Pseudomonadota bacterium]